MPIVGTIVTIVVGLITLVGIVLAITKLAGPVFIGTDQIGIVERKWGGKERSAGSIIARNGENGVQAGMLMTGLHFRPGLIYKVTKYDFVTIGAGTMGYIFARDGKPLAAEQTLARTMPPEAYLDVAKFLDDGGQKGPQRAVLREGTFIINLAQFAVITDSGALFHPMGDDKEIGQMAERIKESGGFKPVVIKNDADQCGIVVVHDGPSLPSGTLIAPSVGDDSTNLATYHNNFQDIEKFMVAGGFRGRQYQVITEGTYWINRLFATVELIKKTIVHVGYTGVVVSYYGDQGEDVSGADYRHGELVENGKRGIWQDGLQPGKYAFNTYAGSVIMVPTTNIILKWIEGETGGEHEYDSKLAEIEMITRDAFEPRLPLQVVIHIDYQKAPRVIQRFGDVGVLVNQSLDPMVSSFFKNIGQTRTLIELLQQRGEIQNEAMDKMKAEFALYDLSLEGVLIGTPRPAAGDDRIEQILNQLRDRQVAEEKKETFRLQTEAAEKERELNEANAAAEQQKELTKSKIAIEVQENQGAAEAAKAKQDAQRIETLASAEARRVELSAEAEAKKVKLVADADAERITKTGQADADKVSAMADAEAKRAEKVGLAEAAAILKRNEAFQGPGAALQVQQTVGLGIADAIQKTGQRLTPDQVINFGGGGEGGAPNLVETLLTLVMSDKIGVPVTLEKTPVTEPADPDVVVPIPTTAEEPAESEMATEPMPVAAGAETEVIPTAEKTPKSEKRERKPRTPGSTTQQ